MTTISQAAALSSDINSNVPVFLAPMSELFAPADQQTATPKPVEAMLARASTPEQQEKFAKIKAENERQDAEKALARIFRECRTG